MTQHVSPTQAAAPERLAKSKKRTSAKRGAVAPRKQPAAASRPRKAPAPASSPSSAATSTSATLRLVRTQPAPKRTEPRFPALKALPPPGPESHFRQDTRRTSERLQSILTQNPTAESFTVEQILQVLGVSSFGTSLMFFSLPEVLPIPMPGISALVVLPTLALGWQMSAGRQEVRLPKFLLERSVPRKALAAAVYAILPVLRRAEKSTKPRWEWASSPSAQRLIGMFVFLLALSIAFPIPGFNMPQAISIFIIGLGLVERDGLIICAGVVLGAISVLALGALVIGLTSFLGL
ncbi:hypothetical protein DB346_20020 [Verrucomicrobia bacterium LW23]|nr:hypothetical protein DB346_20020 [Verrucomicrobia bacterium LW23]